MLTRRLAPLIVALVVLACRAVRQLMTSHMRLSRRTSPLFNPGAFGKSGSGGVGTGAVVRRGCSPEHCYDDLFVEWVEHGEGRRPKVIATKYIREIPGLTHVSEIKFRVLEKEHQAAGTTRGQRRRRQVDAMFFILGRPQNTARRKASAGALG